LMSIQRKSSLSSPVLPNTLDSSTTPASMRFCRSGHGVVADEVRGGKAKRAGADKVL
jgi:hypothetical protein